jgi:hypothetical protein
VKRTTLLLAAIAIAIAIAACTAPAPAPDAPAPSEQTVSRTSLSQRCTNDEHGYTVSYPEGWHTNDGSVLPPCSVFAPAPVEVPQNSELPFDMPVVIDMEPVEIEQLTRTSQFERVLSKTALTIGGRKAARVEVEATGEGLADRGMRSVRYVIDAGGGRALIAVTHRVNDSHERNAAILAQMIETVTIQ